MKKIQDIFSDAYDLDVDVKNPHISKSPEVWKLDATHAYTFHDIKPGEWNHISILRQKEISVEKKKTKNFDALEKKKNKTFSLKSKNILLKKKKTNFSLLPYFLYTKRYLRDLWMIWWWIWIFAVLISSVFLLYLDKIFVENRVNAWYQKLVDIREGHLDLSAVQKKVNNARFDLLLADVFFIPFNILPWDKIYSVWHVISGGRYVSRSLDDMLSLYSKVDNFIEEKSLKNIYFTQLFLNISPELWDIEKSLHKALSDYSKISWLPNKQLQEKREIAIVEITKLLWYVEKLNDNFSQFLDILWHTKKKRYLIVFQNADEIRPTGGFMGSMWLLEIFRWKVQLFQKKDVYAIEWDLKKSDYKRLEAPKWINTLTDTFGLRDANYYANLKDSSNTIKFFTDRGGIDIDGIIYINQNILLRLLELTWPVYFDTLNKEVTSENFSEIMSLVVEAKTFKKWTLWSPKQVLFDFMEVFTEKLLSDGRYFDYLQTLIHDVESRDIMMWSFNEAENSFLEAFGMNGKINYDKTLDYVYPVYTSLSGNKSDRYMKRWYTHTVKSWKNCSYDISLQIENTHDMWKIKRDRILSLINEYDLSSPNLFQIQWAATNKQFMRVILPSNAIINPQSGMDILEYWSRKWVEFFLNTELQETSYYTIDYTLPNTECKNYDYKLYKQPGIPHYDISIEINGENHEYIRREEDFYFELRN